MTDDNHVEKIGPEDEIPGIPVPHDEVQGTPVPELEVPDNEVYGAPVPEGDVYGVPDEDIPSKPKRSAVRAQPRRWPLLMGGGCLLTCCLCCIVPLCLLAATGAGFAAIFSDSESTDTQTQRFSIDPDEPLSLSVDGTAGSVSIRNGGVDDEVTITYTKKAYGWTKNAAEKELERIAVNIQQPTGNENEIAVTVDTERHEDSFWFLANQVDMTITVPEEAAITVTNNTGSITVADVRVRALDLRSNTGSITFEGSLAPDVAQPLRIETNTGSISVVLPSDVAVKLDARTDTGSVSISDQFDQITEENGSSTGAGEAWTGTLGDSTATPPTLRLRTNTGSISVQAQ